MRRAPSLVALIVVATIAFGASAAAAIEPILSPRAYPYLRDGLKGTKGFGEVKPQTIFYGGDPTGLVCDIHWYRWGDSIARGVGVALFVGHNESVAQGHSAKVNVVASQLGTWKGRPAYNRLKWFFTNDGRDRRGPLCL
jgi:hypothetical protein